MPGNSTDQANGAAERGAAPVIQRQEERKGMPGPVLAALLVSCAAILVVGLLVKGGTGQDEHTERGSQDADPELPRPTVTLLTERFSGPDDSFVRQSDLWDHSPRAGSTTEGPASPGAGEDWFAEAGVVQRTNGRGHTTSPFMRMWSTRTDLSFTQAELDITLNGWVGEGSAGWHGVNLWMNRALCSPVPDCTAVDDDRGNSGYALDFVNRDGRLTILKKVPGDTRAQWPEAATSYTQGGTYYELAETRWEPELGRTYRFGGRVVHGAGGAILQVLIDGEVVLEAVDDGTVAGPILTSGRLGLRSDHANITIDNITVAR